MATTIVRINDRDKVGRYLLGVAKELAKISKDITIIEKSDIMQEEEIAALAKKINTPSQHSASSSEKNNDRQGFRRDKKYIFEMLAEQKN